jgi:hypothetical protein
VDDVRALIPWQRQGGAHEVDDRVYRQWIWTGEIQGDVGGPQTLDADPDHRRTPA